MPWLITREGALAQLALFEEMKAGRLEFEKPKGKLLNRFSITAESIVAPTDRWSAKDHPGYEGKTVAILPITGPLMKDDLCGDYGTASLLQVFRQLEAAESVKSIVLIVNSPGGQVDGTEELANAIRDSKKDTVAIVDGMACSAAYWIASSAKQILATASTNIIGSIGTMIAMYDRTQQMEDAGIVLREYYADASTDKNLATREALQGKNGGRLLIETMLNPTNDLFLEAVRANRGATLNEKETLTGKVFLTADAQKLGLIDGQASIDKVVNEKLTKHATSNIFAVKKFPKLAALLGRTPEAAAAEKVELLEADHTALEAAAAELETTKGALATATARVTELETAATTSASTIAALNKEKETLQAEVTRLGALDAGKATTPPATPGASAEATAAKDANGMDFQQSLYAKV